MFQEFINYYLKSFSGLWLYRILLPMGRVCEIFFRFIFICIAVLVLLGTPSVQIYGMIYNFLSFKDPFREKDIGLVLVFCAPRLLRVFFPENRIGHSDITRNGWEKAGWSQR